MNNYASIPLLVGILVLAQIAAAGQPNPPVWPSTVKVYSPNSSKSQIESEVGAAYGSNGGLSQNGQFSDLRFAFLFQPGSYDANIPVGYYTQVLGLGATPDQVKFTGERGVYCESANQQQSPGSLDTFWRSAENFESHAWWRPFQGISGMVWAVSQAAPLRRIIVKNDLSVFWNQSYSSGGYLANSRVEKTLHNGTQQQWMHRNVEMRSVNGGAWNIVYSGCKGNPGPRCGNHSDTVIDQTPNIAEKPFISFENDRYYLNRPKQARNASGANFDDGDKFDFSQVYLADAAKDTAKTINAHLAAGLHVVLSPGIYHLEAPLTLSHNGQVLLGIGIATLAAENLEGAVRITDNVTGTRVAGV
jgi:hypothetical protein